jgi:hypothetical protein
MRRGVVTSEHTKQKISQSNTGKVPWNKGIPRTPEERQKMSSTRKLNAKTKPEWNKRPKHTEETKEKLSKRAKNRKILICPHCDIKCDVSNYSRWHGDQCKVLVRKSQ